MADSDIQALLDPDASALPSGRGIRIIRREPDSGSPALSHYYLQGNTRGVGKAMWVSVTASDTDDQKKTAILAAFGVA